MNYVIAIVSLTAGNFAYQAMFDEQFIVAFERSYFQAVAIILVGFLQSWNSK